MIKEVALCLALVACSKSSDAPKPEPTPAAPTPAVVADAADPAAPRNPGPAVGSPDFDFDKLERVEKIDFMKRQVVPRMKKLFQEFDGEKFSEFTCKTCHGKDPKGAKYKMPSPDLPKLDFAALEAGKQEPKIAEFMAKAVKPEMAKLLNKPEHSDSNPKGFGCLACHEQKS